MNRRDAISSLGGAAVFALASNALAQAKATPANSPAPAAPKNNDALLAAAEACTDAGEECFDHCVNMLSRGDTSMAECFATVRMMLPTCTALEALVRGNSPHLKTFAAACAKICRDCEKACKKHASEHPPCKACMDACAKCAAECEKL
jgi:Cys-rich four helix bundle protein (predicted Tat secretion target)